MQAATGAYIHQRKLLLTLVDNLHCSPDRHALHWWASALRLAVKMHWTLIYLLDTHFFLLLDQVLTERRAVAWMVILLPSALILAT